MQNLMDIIMQSELTQTEKISYILPIYNVQQYLIKCLDSIQNQSSPHWETILIDDGSTDGSPEICKEYAWKDSRFKYLRQDNKGQGAARNRGIDLATGDYICFVDPDDWIDERMAQDLLSIMRSSDADFANFGFDFYTEDNDVDRVFNNFSKAELIGRSIFEHAMLDNDIYSTSCNKIYRTKFLRQHGIRFPHLRAYEDLFFSRKLALHATKCSFVSSVYYHALIRSESTTRRMTIGNFSQAIDAIEHQRAVFLNEKSTKDDRDLFTAHTVKFTTSLIFQAAFRVKDRQEFLRYVNLLQKSGMPHTTGYHILSRLTLKNRIMALLSQKPLLARFFAKGLSYIGIKPY